MFICIIRKQTIPELQRITSESQILDLGELLPNPEISHYVSNVQSII